MNQSGDYIIIGRLTQDTSREALLQAAASLAWDMRGLNTAVVIQEPLKTNSKTVGLAGKDELAHYKVVVTG